MATGPCRPAGSTTRSPHAPTAVAWPRCACCWPSTRRPSSRSPTGWAAGVPPRGVAIGISLSIDPLGAGLAAFAALLVTAALAYSLRYFDAIEGLFHGLMLLFMAGMVGFCLTGDLFNLVVFFELMSAAAYALTAYRIEERAPIQGAINFAITNSIAGYAMFIARRPALRPHRRAQHGPDRRRAGRPARPTRW